MSHLSPAEFVDFAEGVLEPARAAHANGCDSCRAQAAVVRDALRMVEASDGVPEPSPVFWDHLSARVREGIDAAPRRSWFAFGFRGFQPELAFLALAVVLFSVAVLVPGLRRAGTPTEVATAPEIAPAGGQEVELTLDPNNAAVWAVLTAAAEDLQLDEAQAAGMAVHPAAIDRAVQALSAAELSELGRLLQSELKRSSN